MRLSDPTQTSEWRAIALECKLTRQLCGSGLTSISRADYATGLGEYYSAFFALSVGIERLCKLILCFFEHKSTKTFPSQKRFREYGHNLTRLTGTVRNHEETTNLSREYDSLDDEICTAIISHLSAFASASEGRYANFLIMETGRHVATYEPVSEWNNLVGGKILDRHFRGTRSESSARDRARVIEALLGTYSTVQHTSEDWSRLTTVEAASFRTAENKVLQKFGRFYSFKIIRSLAEIFNEATRMHGYEEGGELWFGHYEHFQTFTLPNSFGLSRKNWPLT